MAIQFGSVPIEVNAARKAAFAQALRHALGTRSEEWLAGQTGKSLSAIRTWTRALHTPSPQEVFDLEDLVGVQAGTLSRPLGYVRADEGPEPHPCTLAEALRTDDSIPKRLKDTIESVVALWESRDPDSPTSSTSPRAVKSRSANR